jgi:alpha-tubulin suppressor-like RCC1 family protein
MAPVIGALGGLRRVGVPVLAALCLGLASASSAAGVSLPGAVVAWGYNGEGGLGNGTTANSWTPVQVKGVGGVGLLTGVLAVSAGYEHSLALLSNGTVAAWGDDEWGQLGNGTTTLASSTPTLVLGVSGTGVLSSVKAIAAGELHSLALLSNGTVVAWGHNSAGELGNGTMTAYSSTPVPVKGVGGSGVLSGVVAIAAGAQDSLALLSNGTVVAWGANEYGQLGNGATTTRALDLVCEGTGLVM